MINLTDSILTVSSLSAAMAAVASWKSVTQNKQDALERRQPALLGAVAQLEGRAIGDETPTYLNVLNAGGTAKNVFCLAVLGDCYFANPVGRGFLRPEQESEVEAEMLLCRDRRAILMCRDLKQQVWVWDLDRNVRVYDGKTTDPSNFAAFWFDFYGEDLDSLTRVGSKVQVIRS